MSRLSLCFESFDMAWWEYDLPSGKVTCAPEKFTMLGLPVEEEPLPVDFWRDKIHPEDRERADRLMQEAVTKVGTSYTLQYRLLRSDGTYGLFEDRGKVVKWDLDGAPLLICGAVRKLDPQEASDD